jgi:hypothetical protein
VEKISYFLVWLFHILDGPRPQDAGAPLLSLLRHFVRMPDLKTSSRYILRKDAAQHFFLIGSDSNGPKNIDGLPKISDKKLHYIPTFCSYFPKYRRCTYQALGR